MKSKLFIKILITLLVVLFATSMFNNFVYADNFDFTGFEKEADSTIKTPVKDVMGAIIAVMRIVCTGIAIIMIAVLGIKYMIAAPGDRAEIKKSAMQYVVGAFILFGSAGILTILEKAITATIG